MALNFLGLGINFASQDKGLTDSLSDITAGVGNLSKSLASISLASAKIALKTPNFGPAMSMVNQLAQDMKVTTTMIEAWNVQVDKTASAAMAGLNMTTGEFKRARREVSKTAFSMNTDIGSVTQSFVALKQSGIDIKKFGFKDFGEFQRFMEVTGTDSTKFIASLKSMTTQLGFSEKEMTNMIRTQVAVGRKFNRGREAVSNYADTIALMTQNAALLPDTFGKEEIKRFVLGSEIAAGALMQIGFTADEATATSQALTQTLMQGQQGLDRVFSGLEETLGPQMEVLLENFGGDANAAFEMLQKSPEQFIAAIGKTVSQVEEMDGVDLSRFRAQMSDAFGINVLKAVGNYDALAKAVEEGGKNIKVTGKETAELAKKHKDGRTAAERFNIAQEQMVTRMKQTEGVMSDQEFLKSYRKQTRDLTDTLSEMAADKGPVGMLTKKMIEFRVFGIGGTLGAGSKMGLMLGELAKQFGPILAVLPGVLQGFKALASPMTLVAGAIAGIYFATKDLSKGSGSILRPFIDKIKKEAPAFIVKVKDVFLTVFDTVSDIVKDLWGRIDWNAVLNILKRSLSYVFDLSLRFAMLVLDLAGRLVNYLLNDVDWNRVGNALGKGLFYVVGIALTFLWEALKALPGIIIDVVAGALDFVFGAIDGFIDKLADKFGILWPLIEGLGILIKTAVVLAFVAAGVAAAAFGTRAVIVFAVNLKQAVMAFLFQLKMMAPTLAAAMPQLLLIAAVIAAIVATMDMWGPAITDAIWGYEMSAKQLESNAAIQKRIAAGEAQLAKERQERFRKEQELIKGLSLVEFSNSAVDATNKVQALHEASVRAAKGHASSLGDARRAMQEFARANAEFEKQYGITKKQSQDNIKLSKQLLGIDENLIASIRAKDAAAAEALDAERSRIASVTHERLNQAMAERAANKLSAEEYRARVLEIRSFAAEQRDEFKLTAELIVGAASVQDMELQKLVNNAGAVAKYYAAEFSKNNKLAVLEMSGLSDTQKQQLDKQRSQLMRAMEAELSSVFGNAKLTKEEMVKQAGEITAKFDELGKKFGETTKLAVEAAAAGNEQAAQQSLATLDAVVKAGTDKVAKTTSKQADILMKEMGVSGKDAAEMIGEIANIRPKTFIRNIGVVKKHFVDFLHTMENTAEKLIDATTASLNAFWETSKAGWEKQTQLIQDWSNSAGMHIQKYWNAAFTEAFRSALRFQRQIVQMSERALRMEAGPAVPGVAEPTDTGEAESQNPALGLVSAINNPSWASNEEAIIPSALIRQTALLEALVQISSVGAGTEARKIRSEVFKGASRVD